MGKDFISSETAALDHHSQHGNYKVIFPICFVLAFLIHVPKGEIGDNFSVWRSLGQKLCRALNGVLTPCCGKCIHVPATSPWNWAAGADATTCSYNNSAEVGISLYHCQSPHSFSNWTSDGEVWWEAMGGWPLVESMNYEAPVWILLHLVYSQCCKDYKCMWSTLRIINA